jgi:hypothetical protein
MEKAVRYLLKKQRYGRWESNLNGPEIGRSGIKFSWDIGITSLCSLALLSYPGREKETSAKAIKKAVRYLLRNLRKIPRRTLEIGDADLELGYSLKFFLQLKTKRHFKKDLKRIERLIRWIIKVLERNQTSLGGWDYYPNRDIAGVKSFQTAAILLNLIKAKEMGFKVKKGVLKKAADILQKMRGKEGGYLYYFRRGMNLRKRIGARIRPSYFSAELKGSLGRIGVCELALYRAGRWSREDLKKAVEKFFKYHRYIEKALKGYHSCIYLFGHYYISECLKILQKERAQRYACKLREVVLKKQRRNGSWMDMYEAGRCYGTAMGILILANVKRILQEK